ncbi:MAG: hypothetical protein H6738_04690 [Alphaproteobacteria bacterium]|nr:hypothetical protein [Alphaproteobacteria bacterium]MCB9696071.1 hypothetical protein [Alphaproteobacteria bacterium]
MLVLLVAACHKSPPASPEPAPEVPAAVEQAPAPAPEPEPEPEPEPVVPGPVLNCLTGADCPSGVCEGVGCDEDHPGVCAEDMRACTRDLRPYCGCDGETFLAGGNCPMRRYRNKGPCPEPE